VPTKSTPSPKVDSGPPLVVAAHEVCVQIPLVGRISGVCSRQHLSPSKLAGGSPPDKIIVIDREVFDQVLELDEDDELFSKDMVDAYFLQAEKTFSDMDAALCAIFSSLPSRSFP
jgi:hypothetical protein